MLEIVISVILAPLALLALLFIVLLAIGVVKSFKKKTKVIYCGTEEQLNLAKEVLDAANTIYEVGLVDGEWEIKVF